MDAPKQFTPPRRPPTGEQISSARIKAGLSQTELAAILDVSPQRVWQWEAGNAGTKDAGLIESLWRLVEENTRQV